MKQNYTVISTGTLYQIHNNLYIISGYPFLYINSEKVLIFSDSHLGQESSLSPSTYRTGISTSTYRLVEKLTEVLKIVEIKSIVINGDLKHFTTSIKQQELLEMKYLFSFLKSQNLNVYITQGNHDKMIEIAMEYLNLDNLHLSSHIKIDDIFIFHGDLDMEFIDAKTIVLGHEHPSFILSDNIGTRMKLPAFVKISLDMTTMVECGIILPSVSEISLGVNFPISSREEFLSPFLRKHAIMSEICVLPFDYEVGLFELPNLK